MVPHGPSVLQVHLRDSYTRPHDNKSASVSSKFWTVQVCMATKVAVEEWQLMPMCMCHNVEDSVRSLLTHTWDM